jgi:hypothetical protein
MSKTMPISEVKTRLPELVSGVEERREVYEQLAERLRQVGEHK